MTDDWYVLIEEDTRVTERADGVDLKLHHWTLVATHPISGTEERALAAAEDAALNYLPQRLARHARRGETPARWAFRTTGGDWVVRVRQHHRECHIRVSTARLVHEREEVQAPPKSLKERLRAAVMEGPEHPEPWAPKE